MRSFFILTALLAGLMLAGCKAKPIESKEAASAAEPPADAQPLSALTPLKAGALLSVLPEKGTALVNLWSTWCEPCVAEMPDLVEIGRAPDTHLVLISTDAVDQRPDALEFLQEVKAEGPAYVRDEPDVTFIDGVHKDWSGSLPAFLVYQDRQLKHFHQGESDVETIRSWLAAARGG